MDLGLTKQETAKRLGTWSEALRNWEVGRTRPSPKHLTAISGFLGTDPLPDPCALGRRLRDWRQANRISKARAGRLAGLREQTIAHVESGKGRWVSSKVSGAIEQLLGC